MTSDAEPAASGPSLDALVGHLTALLYAADEPLALDEAARILEVPRPVVQTVVDRLDADPPPGLALQRHGEALRLVTAPASSHAPGLAIRRPECRVPSTGLDSVLSTQYSRLAEGAHSAAGRLPRGV